LRLDFQAVPSLAERYAVLDAETGEPIEDIAWADDETGTYATIKKRPRTITDPQVADLRIKSADGRFALQIHRGAIEFLDRAVSPFKAELLALLDDPDVIAAIRYIAQNTRDAG
jgi:hypothetical protein